MAATQVCCTCLSFDVEMLSLNDDEIRECLEQVVTFHIEIDLENKLLRNVCEECVSLLKKFVQFQQICIEANQRLRQMLKQSTRLTKDSLLRESQELYSKTMIDFDDQRLNFEKKFLQVESSDESESENDSENTPVNSQSDAGLNNDNVKDEIGLENSTHLLKQENEKTKTKSSDTQLDDVISVMPESIGSEKIENQTSETNKDGEDSTKLPSNIILKEYLMRTSELDDNLKNKPVSCESDMDSNRIFKEMKVGNLPRLEPQAEKYELDIRIDSVRSEASEKVSAKTLETNEDGEYLNDAIELSTKETMNENRVKETPDAKTDHAVRIVLTKEQQIEEMSKKKSSESYLEANFKCCDCFQIFVLKETFEVHMKLHDKSRGDCVCDVCKLRYSNLTQLRAHQTTHRIRYKCLTCGEIFKTHKQAIIHQNLHHDTTFKCEKCGEKFQNDEKYKRHSRKAHPTPYVCDLCKDYFPNKHHLKSHQRFSKECAKKSTILECKRCDVEFDKFQPWYNHTVGHAALGKEEPPPTECLICKHETTSWNDWKDHVCREHRKKKTSNNPNVKKQDLTYLCDLCGKNMRSFYELKKHKYRHHPDTRKGDVPFKRFKWTLKCEICSRSFRSHNMKRHMLTHTGEKPFKCDVCQRGFTQAVTRDLHVRVVHEKLEHPRRRRRMTLDEQNDKKNKRRTNKKSAKILNKPKVKVSSYPCPHCSKVCTSKFYLRSHLRRHTGEKPFSCDICDKAFTQQSNLSRHQVVHTGEKNYKCDLCEKSYSQVVGLTSHVNTIHLNLPHPPRKPRKRSARQ